MPRGGNHRTAHKRKRVVFVKLPDGDTQHVASGRYVFTHAVIAQKGTHCEPGYASGRWYARSWHESKQRARTLADAVDQEHRVDWTSGSPIRREERWAEVRVVPVKIKLEQAWAK